MIDHVYMLLSDQERSILRMERVRALEADLCRASLNYEDALSDAEREGVANDIQAFKERLKVHYEAMGLEDRPLSEDTKEE